MAGQLRWRFVNREFHVANVQVGREARPYSRRTMKMLIAFAVVGSLLGRAGQAPSPRSTIWHGSQDRGPGPDGADLRARIEGTINGKAGSEEWRWSPGALK